MQRYIITIALVCALQLFAFSSSSPVVDNTGPMLNVISATPNEIKGEYYSDLAEENGIYFRSATYEDDSYFIQITTTDGDPILVFKGSHSSNSVAFVSILGTEFIIITNSSDGNIFSLVPYYVPADYRQQVEEAIFQNSYETLTDLLKYLDQEQASQEELSSLTALLQRPETELIRAAAQAVENSGSEGSETIAAMMLQDLSLQLKIAKAEFLKKYEQKHNSHQNHHSPIAKRQDNNGHDVDVSIGFGFIRFGFNRLSAAQREQRRLERQQRRLERRLERQQRRRERQPELESPGATSAQRITRSNAESEQ